MKALEGYLVVLRRAIDGSAAMPPEDVSTTNPDYRGIYRMPPYPSTVQEEQGVLDDYVFGAYKNDAGVIPDRGLALELLHRFSKSPRGFELVYVRTTDLQSQPLPVSASLLGFDVALGMSPFWSAVWDWLPKHDAFRDRLNEYGLFKRIEDAQAYLVNYETECPPDPRPDLLIWQVYVV